MNRRNLLTLGVALVALLVLSPPPSAHAQEASSGSGFQGAAQLSAYAPPASVLLHVDYARLRRAPIYETLGAEIMGPNRRKRFQEQTGFNLNKDLERLMVVVRDGVGDEYTEQDTLVIMQGSFNREKIVAALEEEAQGKLKEQDHHGVTLYLQPGARDQQGEAALAITGNYLVMGGRPMVEQSVSLITTGKGDSVAGQAALMAMYGKVSSDAVAGFLLSPAAVRGMVGGGGGPMRNPLAGARGIYGEVKAGKALDLELSVVCMDGNVALGVEQAMKVMVRAMGTSPALSGTPFAALLGRMNTSVVGEEVKASVSLGADEVKGMGRAALRRQPAPGPARRAPGATSEERRPNPGRRGGAGAPVLGSSPPSPPPASSPEGTKAP